MQHFCVVKKTWEQVSEIIRSGINSAWSRQRCLELRGLLEDICLGKGKLSHISEINLLAQNLGHLIHEPGCLEISQVVLSALKQDQQVFLNHIENKICPTGECVCLTPPPCQMACPAGVDVPGYVHLIAKGSDKEAVSLIRKDNPLPLICGYVCTNPCEFKCVRSRMDDPVSIRNLKRFAAEQVLEQGGYKNSAKLPDNGHRVCVLGAGPAGLTSAYFLALKGYQVTVIECLPFAGGMTRVGIPRYRLPEEVIEKEVAYIEELGVEFRFNTRLGEHVTIESLKKQGMEAFVLACGAHSSMSCGLEGEKECPNVWPAIDFLRRVSLGEKPFIGKSAAVIGGGNVAIDAARTALRLGCGKVTIVYRRALEQMPAADEEIRQAQEEGIEFSFLSAPLSLAYENGEFHGLLCLRTKMGEQDATGRRRPIIIKGSEFKIPADSVFSAVGQKVITEDFSFLDQDCWTKRGTIKVDAGMATSVKGIFAAGDIQTGPATVIQAIAGGKIAATAIDKYLSGKSQPIFPQLPKRRTCFSCEETQLIEVARLKRVEMPETELDMRNNFQLVEKGLDKKSARKEALRCLRCDVCASCYACVDICRDQVGMDALSPWFALQAKPQPGDIQKALNRCIGCGACANACPNGAMVIEDREDERLLKFCGIVLKRLPLTSCEICGKNIAPEVYLKHMAQKIDQDQSQMVFAHLCPDCAAKIYAEKMVG